MSKTRALQLYLVDTLLPSVQKRFLTILSDEEIEQIAKNIAVHYVNRSKYKRWDNLSSINLNIALEDVENIDSYEISPISLKKLAMETSMLLYGCCISLDMDEGSYTYFGGIIHEQSIKNPYSEMYTKNVVLL